MHELKPAKLNKNVFFPSAILIAVFVLLASLFSDQTALYLAALQSRLVHQFGWIYLLMVAGFLVFAISLALSQHGRIKLGPEHSEPDYSYSAWFAMLFSAGMGIGLLFFGVAEPLKHFMAPPTGDPETIQAAQSALSITFFHWGFHAWAIYAVVGLSLAYFGFRHGLPMAMRSALYPLIGDRIYGPLGNMVDIFAIIGTVFGVATSLALGVMQIHAGLSFLFGLAGTTAMLLLLIVIITGFSTISVMLGMDRGIKRLSELNLVFAITLMLFVLILGPTWRLLPFFVENIGNYLSGIVKDTFTLYAYNPSDWISDWTLFYWSWWIAWSPFVGMFIARVSRGRTIREFLSGVLLVPTGFTFMWMTIFGNTAISFEMDGVAKLGEVAMTNTPVALFEFLSHFPWGGFASVIAVLSVLTFFITSMDSGALVIDMLSFGGRQNERVWSRIFWAVAVGALAAVLLILGGLEALQTTVLLSAFPFMFVMMMICIGLVRGLHMETLRQKVHVSSSHVVVARSRASWEKRLRSIITHPTYSKVNDFLSSVVHRALTQVTTELKRQNIKATLSETDDAIRVEVHQGEEINFIYKVQLKSYATPSFAFPKFEEDEAKQTKYCRAEVHLLEGNQYYDIMGYTEEEVIEDVLSQYDKHMQFLHLADQ